MQVAQLNSPGGQQRPPFLEAALAQPCLEGGESLGNFTVQIVFAKILSIPAFPAAGASTRPVRGHRTKELAWRRAHQPILQAFVGQWVVLEGERIVSAGPDLAVVVAQARAEGIQVPYVFHVEELNGDIVRIGL